MKSVFTNKLFRVLCGAFVIGSAVYTGAFFVVKEGEAWRAAEKTIMSSVDAKNKYGAVKEVGMSFSGFSYSLRGGIEKINLRANVTGDLAAGHVYVRLHRDNGGEWLVDSLSIQR